MGAVPRDTRLLASLTLVHKMSAVLPSYHLIKYESSFPHISTYWANGISLLENHWNLSQGFRVAGKQLSRCFLPPTLFLPSLPHHNERYHQSPSAPLFLSLPTAIHEKSQLDLPTVSSVFSKACTQPKHPPSLSWSTAKASWSLPFNLQSFSDQQSEWSVKT